MAFKVNMKGFNQTINKINRIAMSNKLFTGLIILMMNIGSKYVMLELSPTQEALVKNVITRQILIFCMVWLGTKDLIMSLILTAVFHVLTTYLFNENSRFCVIPRQFQILKKAVDENKDGKISDVELNNAIRVLEKAKKEKQQDIYAEVLENFQYSRI